MNKIILISSMFDRSQTVNVYKNGELVATDRVPQEAAATLIKELSGEFSINDITLVGNTQYLEKFKKELANEFSAFNITTIER